MGLWLLLFRHDDWKRLYSDNCSLRTTEEWNSEGSPSINMPIGILYIVIGVIYQVLAFYLFFRDSKSLETGWICHNSVIKL